MSVHPRFGVELRDTRYRVQAPNASFRNAMVVALDARSATLGEMLQADQWMSAVFVGFPALADDAKRDRAAWQKILAAHPMDSIVMVGTSGEALVMGEEVGQACLGRPMKLAAILIAGEAPEQIVNADLARLRPWIHTLAVLTEASSLPGLLHAIRA
jgi:hypothetical protein